MVFLIAAASACDRDPPSPSAAPPLRILASDPEALQRDVPREKALRFRVSRLVRPTSVIRQSIRVTPGLIDAETGESPAGSVFFEPQWDPYDRVVTFELPPWNRWIPSTLYSVTVLPPADDSTVAGLRSLDGIALDQPESFSFMAGASVSDPEHDVDDTWPTVDFCTGAEADGIPGVLPVLRAACGTSSCHSSVGGNAPPMGLDLATPDGIRSTAIRVTARQTMRSGMVGPPSNNPTTFGDSMPRVDPGNPGNSYLMYKLLIHEGNYPNALEADDTSRPWVGDLPPDTAAPVGDIEYLRRSFVQGTPMPMQGSLRPSEMRALMTWIGQGASVKDCPSVR